MIISLVYLILYPGLGSFKGVLNWSQDSRLENSNSHYEKVFAKQREEIANSSIANLQENESFMKSAESIFSRNCATCHGYEGTGQAKSFPNLKDSDWQWGGTEEQIEKSILDGRNAQMPGFKGTLAEDQISNIGQYVLGLHKGSSELRGKNKFEQTCAVCHGKEGKGNPLLGAPNLSDNVWLYGKEEQDVLLTIRNGRFGEMPAFKDRLDPPQIRLLVAWLRK